MQIILGIDPGSRITGFGVIESDGRHSRHIHSGHLRLGDIELSERLGLIYTGIEEIIQAYQPTQMAIENVFMAKNAASALKLGQARGAAICAAVVKKLPVFEYSAREVKQAITGKGGADKIQVQHMTRILLNITGHLQSDRADALGVALCHAHVSAFNARIRQPSLLANIKRDRT